MNNEKLENLLNLSLDSTMEERDKSEILNVGYDKEEQTWELIVKYHGDLEKAASDQVTVELLEAGYAIVTLPQSLIDAFAQLEEVEYIEKPKRLFFNVAQGKAASCILPVTVREPYLTGKGVVVAVIDSGIDYAHPDFRNKDGSTRIIALWDQSVSSDPAKGYAPPAGFTQGTVFTRDDINRALQEENEAGRMRVVPSRDISGHGTAVAGIAAEVAPESELLIVKLGSGTAQGFPKTTELMRALAYVSGQASLLGRPLAVNLSFGNTYGAHDGTSLLERYINNISEIGRNVISVGSGNEGAASGHTSGVVRMGSNTVVDLAVAPYETTTSVQLWKDYSDLFDLLVTAPGGETKAVDLSREGTERIVFAGTELLIYVGLPTPYSVNQEIFLDFLPTDRYITEGVWSFTFIPRKIVTGYYRMYLPSEVVRNADTGFYRPDPDATFTIPSTASKVITVGAYDTVYDAYADFSGRGFPAESYPFAADNSSLIKPDLVAPGVNIVSTAPGGGYGQFTGTSFAAPFVTGSSALMMEWGIIRGNDPFLYGEKVKAYLIRGARQLPGYNRFPNAQVGWGALCLSQSLPS